MQFIAPKKAIVEAVAKVEPVADKKGSLPALANVLVSCDGDALFAATDLYRAASVRLDVKPISAGTVALPAKDLLDRLKAMPDGDVEISVGDDCAATIKAVGSARRYKLHGMPGAEFPHIRKCPDDATKLSWTSGDLREAIRRVRFAISTDETRPHVNSMLLQATGKALRTVATDGHRLALAEMSWDNAVEATCLIPLPAVDHLLKLLDADGSHDTAELRLSGPSAFWSAGGVQFSCKLVDATFPPYQQVIPAKPDHSASVPRDAFSDALRAVSVASSERTGGVRLQFSAGTLHVSAKDPDAGDGADEVAIDYDGPEVTIGVNAKYMLDALSAFEDDAVTIGVSGELDPIKVTSESKQSTQVCMPMRT